MKKYLALLCILLSFSVMADEVARKKIKVGGYFWPPFVELQSRNYQGMTLDLIDAANAIQGDFEFEFVLTTPANRYKDFYHHKFDLIFFEDINAGWNAYPVSASKPLAKGTELFIALNKTGRNQTFFQDLPEKSISAVKGLPYSFTDHSTNDEYLKENFNIRFHDIPDQVLQDVLDGKSEIGVINSLALERAVLRNPKIKNNLLIGKKIDHDFVLSILARDNGQISIEQVNVMIDRLNKEGILEKLWEQYHLDPKV